MDLAAGTAGRYHCFHVHFVVQCTGDRNRWGYEKWGKPAGIQNRLLDMIRTSSPEGIVILLSGDRHIAEYSVIGGGLDYPAGHHLHGLTHTWGQIQEEANQFEWAHSMIERTSAYTTTVPG